MARGPITKPAKSRKRSPPASEPMIESVLTEALGGSRATKLGRVASQTGRSLTSLLQAAVDNFLCGMKHIPSEPAKNPEAIALGKARWANVSPEERAAQNRKAVNARWERYRAEKAARDKEFKK